MAIYLFSSICGLFSTFGTQIFRMFCLQIWLFWCLPVLHSLPHRSFCCREPMNLSRRMYLPFSFSSLAVLVFASIVSIPSFSCAFTSSFLNRHIHHQFKMVACVLDVGFHHLVFHLSSERKSKKSSNNLSKMLGNNITYTSFIFWGTLKAPTCLLFTGLHRDFSLTFALNFLGLTTFLRQIFEKIYSSDFLTTFYDNDFWFIPQQVWFPADYLLFHFLAGSPDHLHKPNYAFW